MKAREIGREAAVGERVCTVLSVVCSLHIVYAMLWYGMVCCVDCIALGEWSSSPYVRRRSIFIPILYYIELRFT